MAGGERFSRDQERAISALLVCPTVIAAAERCGVSAASLRRWMKDPEFSAAYEEARRRVLDASVNFLQEGMAAALKAMIRDTESKSFSERLQASQLIVETAIKGTEIAGILPRLRAVEAKLDATGNDGPADPPGERPAADPPATPG